MNDDHKGDLHPWIEPDVEARIVALVLGEASEFEAEELERLMSERPEVRIFKRRLEAVDGLLGEALRPGSDADWKLAPDRREELKRALNIGSGKDRSGARATSKGAEQHRERRVGRASRRVLWSVAACLVMTLFTVVIWTGLSGGFASLEADSAARELDRQRAVVRQYMSEERGNLLSASGGSESRGGDSKEQSWEGYSREELRRLRVDNNKSFFESPQATAPTEDAGESRSVSGGLGGGGAAISPKPATKPAAGPATADLPALSARFATPAAESPVPAGEPPAADPGSRSDRFGLLGERPLSEASDGVVAEAETAPDSKIEQEERAGPGGGGADEATGPAYRAKTQDESAPSDRSAGDHFTAEASPRDQAPLPKGETMATEGEVESLLERQSALADRRENKKDLQPGAPDGPSETYFGRPESGEERERDILERFSLAESELPLADSRVRPERALEDGLDAPDETDEKSRSYEWGGAAAEKPAEPLSKEGKVAGVEKRDRIDGGLALEELDKTRQRDRNGQGRASKRGRQAQQEAQSDFDADDHGVEKLEQGVERLESKLEGAKQLPQQTAGETNLNLWDVQQSAQEDGEALGETYSRGRELEEVPPGETLDAIAGQARAGTTRPSGAAVQLGTSVERDYATRRWEVPAAAWKKLRAGQGGAGDLDELLFGSSDDLLADPPAEVIARYGIEFPENAAASYSPATGTFVVKNTDENLELIENLVNDAVESVTRDQALLQDFEKSAATEPYSTFSLHVSDVSFKLAQAALARGEWPAPEQVRVEEFVNAFDYGDPTPTQEEKVACAMEQAAHPFLQQRNLLRVSMRTAALGRTADTPLRLTILLDNSGSMERPDRAQSLRAAFALLARQLTPNDRVTLITFAREARLLADRVSGSRAGELVELVARRQSEGGTNIEEALKVGLAKAQEQFVAAGQNRIILLTDGAANLGNANPEHLAERIERMRQQGIAFDACGVGTDDLNDAILETLARKGDGRYYVLDRPEDADAGFAKQIAGALRPAARNVKVQVQFNPERVGHYRLYGFEKHRLQKEDFRNDKVDAAELAAEEAGNAIYHFEVLPEGRGEIGSVSVRFQDVETGRMIEREWTIPYNEQVSPLAEASPSIRLAGGAALLAEKLKGGMLGDVVEMKRLNKLISPLPSAYPSAERVRVLSAMAGAVRDLAPE